MSQEIDENDITPLKLVKNFYKSCKDMDKINKIGIDRIVEKIKFLGGWPVVKSHDWDEKKWFWQWVAQNIELIGFGSNYIFSYGLSIDLKNSSQRILVVNSKNYFRKNFTKEINLNFIKGRPTRLGHQQRVFNQRPRR
jgi:hypothetical protein